MTQLVPEVQDALLPLLNDKAERLVREHVEALEAMGGSRDDRVTATAFRMLLLNHDKRVKLLGRKMQ